MATYETYKYVQLEDDSAHQTPWHQRHVRAAYFSFLSAGILVVFFNMAPGAEPSMLQAQAAGMDQVGSESLIGITPRSVGKNVLGGTQPYTNQGADRLRTALHASPRKNWRPGSNPFREPKGQYELKEHVYEVGKTDRNRFMWDKDYWGYPLPPDQPTWNHSLGIPQMNLYGDPIKPCGNSEFYCEWGAGHPNDPDWGSIRGEGRGPYHEVCVSVTEDLNQGMTNWAPENSPSVKNFDWSTVGCVDAWAFAREIIFSQTFDTVGYKIQCESTNFLLHRYMSLNMQTGFAEKATADYLEQACGQLPRRLRHLAWNEPPSKKSLEQEQRDWDESLQYLRNQPNLGYHVVINGSGVHRLKGGVPRLEDSWGEDDAPEPRGQVVNDWLHKLSQRPDTGYKK